jgi:hypothetical protein
MTMKLEDDVALLAMQGNIYVALLAMETTGAKCLKLAINPEIAHYTGYEVEQAARGQRPPLVGEEVCKEDVGKVES